MFECKDVPVLGSSENADAPGVAFMEEAQPRAEIFLYAKLPP